MVWRRYPFALMWHEMEDMRAELDNLLQQTYASGRLLPPGGIADRMLPALRGEFRVDVREHEDDVIIVADLPGVEKEDVSLQLVNPRALEITCERKDQREEKEEGYYMRERMYGSMHRVVVLPADVSDDDSTASFRNGVLEVRLKKIRGAQKTRIPIE